jgi:hypothetical protein
MHGGTSNAYAHATALITTAQSLNAAGNVLSEIVRGSDGSFHAVITTYDALDWSVGTIGDSFTTTYG